MFVDLPKHRQDLWRKFHPDNYPVWSYTEGKGDECVIPSSTVNLLLMIVTAVILVVGILSPEKVA